MSPARGSFYLAIAKRIPRKPFILQTLAALGYGYLTGMLYPALNFYLLAAITIVGALIISAMFEKIYDGK